MSLTQFTMVEELAFLIKDNLPCKHLVLSVEEALVNLLKDDPSSYGVLELEPMNAYNRLLLHRLAEIFGFSHQSVGEGDDRHLVLERCPETSIPCVLVSDLVWQYDEIQPLTSSYQLLRSNKTSPELKTDMAVGQFSLQEREAAYLAARERIFTGYDGETSGFSKQKPRGIPVVARRMISHALGRSLNPSNETISHRVSEKCGEQSDEMIFLEKDQGNASLSMETYKKSNSPPDKNLGPYCKADVNTFDGSAAMQNDKKIESTTVGRTPNKPGVSRPRRSKIDVDKESLKEEHMGAAKRMFAHALGVPSGKDGILSKRSEMKQMK